MHSPRFLNVGAALVVAEPVVASQCLCHGCEDVGALFIK